MRTRRSFAPSVKPGTTSKERFLSPSEAPRGVAFVFPGQGSQYVGMGKALCDVSETARRVFKRADEILGFALSKLCFEGPEPDLNDTINAQPAILTVSVACL